VLHDRAIRIARRDVQAERVISASAYSMPGTIFLCRAVIRTPEAWFVRRVHHLADPDAPLAGEAVREGSSNRWTERAARTRAQEIYRWFAMGQVRTEYANRPGRHVVRFHDMRYSWSSHGAESIRPLTVVFSAEGELQDIRRESPRGARGGGSGLWEIIGTIWRDIWNPTPPD